MKLVPSATADGPGTGLVKLDFSIHRSRRWLLTLCVAQAEAEFRTAFQRRKSF